VPSLALTPLRKCKSFLLKNVDATFPGLRGSPLSGYGLGEYYWESTRKEHEIHSTYLSILAQLGLLGASCYAFYIFILVRSVLLAAGRHSKEALFAFYFSPFLFGLMLSWGYTYHLRKREFWIAFALLTACCLIARRQAAISGFQSRRIVGGSQPRLRSETRFRRGTMSRPAGLTTPLVCHALSPGGIVLHTCA
jgi:hypothetical protein